MPGANDASLPQFFGAQQSKRPRNVVTVRGPIFISAAAFVHSAEMVENDGALIALVAKHGILTEDHTALSSTKPSVLQFECMGVADTRTKDGLRRTLYDYSVRFEPMKLIRIARTHTQSVNAILTIVEDTQHILQASASWIHL